MWTAEGKKLLYFILLSTHDRSMKRPILTIDTPPDRRGGEAVEIREIEKPYPTVSCVENCVPTAWLWLLSQAAHPEREQQHDGPHDV